MLESLVGKLALLSQQAWKVFATTLGAVFLCPPQEYWGWTDVRKFCSVFLFFFGVAMIWHVGIFIFPRSTNDGRLAIHDLTFLIAHPFLFAPALGLMYVVLDKSLLENNSLFWKAILWLFVGFVICICISSAVRWDSPIGVHRPWLCGFETWVFMTAVAVFIWYSLAMVWHKKMTEYVFLLLSGSAALLALWIPLRVYANWALLKKQAALNPGANLVPGNAAFPVKFALIVAFLFFSCFVLLAVIQFASTMRRELVASVLAASSFLASITLSANHEWLESVYDIIESFDVPMRIAVVVLALITILSLAKYLLKNELHPMS